jgi:hypothetical protein
MHVPSSNYYPLNSYAPAFFQKILVRNYVLGQLLEFALHFKPADLLHEVAAVVSLGLLSQF